MTQLVRLFSISTEGTFREYLETAFATDHQEAVLEAWLESNPDAVIEDGRLLILGRQVRTNLSSFIDLLGVDRRGHLAVIELKRSRTPRETLAQALEYASFAAGLQADELEDILRTYTGDEGASLAQYHREYFELASDEPVAFNEDQRIVIMGQHVSPEIRQTATFLRKKGLRVTCLEFNLFQSESGLKMVSSSIVVGADPSSATSLTSASLPKISESQFLASLDENGLPVLTRILQFAHERSFPVHWGVKGFSVNVDLDSTHVALCFGYPPDSVFKQSIYTALYGRGGLLTKVAASEEVAHHLAAEAQATGLFAPAGRELKCVVTRPFSEDEIATLVTWLDRSASVIRDHGLKSDDD